MSVRIRGGKGHRRRKGCLAWLFGLVLLPLVMGASGCEGDRSKNPPKPDLVVVKNEPAHSSKHCWELRVARGGDSRRVDILCVPASKWNRYRVGDRY